MIPNEKKLGLYIHIPFCKAKCNYCDFNSFSGMEALAGPYFDALEREIEYWAEKLKEHCITSIFIGGGTPSLVDPQLIARLVEGCRARFNIRSEAEISMESNPGTLSGEKLKIYRECGINRLSMGLQASQDRLLKLMGRIHSRAEFDNNISLAIEAGFKNINLDLIFGLPGQTMEDWKETLEYAARPGITHLSCYSLKVEEGTVFAKRIEAGELFPADDELDRQMYAYTIERLSVKGFKHYEISNFAIPGFECKHNLIYWNAEEYVGIGAGAHSYLFGERFNNAYGVEDYILKSNNSEKLRENVQSIDKKESMSEYMILGLRLVDGVSGAEFEARYSEKLDDIFGTKLNKMIKTKLVEQAGDRFKLTAYGLDVANIVFEEFINI